MQCTETLIVVLRLSVRFVIVRDIHESALDALLLDVFYCIIDMCPGLFSNVLHATSSELTSLASFHCLKFLAECTWVTGAIDDGGRYECVHDVIDFR